MPKTEKEVKEEGKKALKFEVIKKIGETQFKYKDIGNISKLDSNSPPDIFIGSKLRYPLVNVGILSPIERDENAWMYDNEKYWAENNFQISDVLHLRSSLINSRFQAKVSDARLNRKLLEMAKEIAQASKPVDVEINLKKNLHFYNSKDQITKPHGMRANLEKARITGNVSIPQKIDKIANDELKAGDAMAYLYKNNFDEYILSKILSVGVLGLKKNRRLVPTRWSITATDDALGRQLIKKIKDYKWIEDYELFFGGFMGNHYLIFLFPNVFSYELFELYLPGSSWNPSNEIKASTDYEDYYGRKSYVSQTAGGYYAARLPILKYLEKIKRQASILAIRIETPSYWAALGVWVVRESVKKTINTNPIKFNSRGEMITAAKQIGKIKFNFDYALILEKSKLLKRISTQINLSKFL
jgi:hypothetical protein